MRLWSIHPKYLDQKGLVALWREALLAKSVLEGKTRGYARHPQLARFRGHPSPVGAINAYLVFVYGEAKQRGYAFDSYKIGKEITGEKLFVNAGQLLYEMEHLRRKVRERDPAKYREIAQVTSVEPHPFFRIRMGPVEGWEKLPD